MRYIFIINKIAGKGRYKKIVPKIEEVCKEKEIEYELRYITESLDASTIARQYEKEENRINNNFNYFRNCFDIWFNCFLRGIFSKIY